MEGEGQQFGVGQVTECQSRLYWLHSSPPCLLWPVQCPRDCVQPYPPTQSARELVSASHSWVWWGRWPYSHLRRHTTTRPRRRAAERSRPRWVKSRVRRDGGRRLRRPCWPNSGARSSSQRARGRCQRARCDERPENPSRLTGDGGSGQRDGRSPGHWPQKPSSARARLRNAYTGMSHTGLASRVWWADWRPGARVELRPGGGDAHRSKGTGWGEHEGGSE